MHQKLLIFLIFINLILFYVSGYASNNSAPLKVCASINNFSQVIILKSSGISKTNFLRFGRSTFKENEGASDNLVRVEKAISDSTDSIRLERRAVWAKRLGIGSLISILIPFVNILSLPAAINAIVLGGNSLKKVKNKKNARQGITFGIITCAIALLIIGIVVLVVNLGGVK